MEVHTNAGSGGHLTLLTHKYEMNLVQDVSSALETRKVTKRSAALFALPPNTKNSSQQKATDSDTVTGMA